ncbi:MAG: antibiotic biosynthesis monooxygenase family protein [Desulfobacterales bacterium]|jgi:heme-degrading monooxygenase HmoA|nr:antibiotic biosynthesis monooxygenase [Desulfobacter sp.]MDP6395741.1 antibiotic biosynthesis monooxygenase family protein [Desulfobacterales bacterium]MDP6681752.1 antibiotic biosynthesis monooxygenase family protein [Desulfobacterales bacterium]MDP6807487.1 antibiotic biosynthesis monooxygenase family protein [Desulfobacterales bacterium]|tara:strand:- start:8337 stop:8651 length:315 start_codon:yes stop_codon:yes gene_type:complete
MSVKVMIKRKVPDGKKADILPLIIKLRRMATSQPGYICGETLVNADDKSEYVVISTWNDLDSWRDWRLSAQRIKIDEELEALSEVTTEYNAYFYGDIYLHQKLK